MPVLTSPWDSPDLVGAALRESLRIGYLVLDDLHSWREFCDGCCENMALQAWKHERRLICTEVHVAPDAGLLLCTRR